MVAISHRADADRIDVVEMRALELDVRRAQAERLVDDEIGDQRADPGDGDVGIKRQRLLQRLVDADLHQQQRDQHVEHQPDHAARMAMRQAREEVRPGDRAGIGVGDVDLELRQDHEGAGQRQRQIRLRQHIAKRLEIHVRRFGGMFGGHAVAERKEGQERAGQQLQRAGDDPARTGAEQRDPPRASSRFAGRAAGSAGSRPARRSAPPARTPPMRRCRTAADRDGRPDRRARRESCVHSANESRIGDRRWPQRAGCAA